MVIILAFQAGDAGSIPVARSFLRTLVLCWLTDWSLSSLGRCVGGEVDLREYFRGDSIDLSLKKHGVQLCFLCSCGVCARTISSESATIKSEGCV